jgi:hypothetical protein
MRSSRSAVKFFAIASSGTSLAVALGVIDKPVAARKWALDGTACYPPSI